MSFSKSLKSCLYNISENNFEEIAISLFKHQARYNIVYKNYIDNLNIQVSKINKLRQIPFLPISFFKTNKVVTGNSWKEEKIFQSSGTTGLNTSQHFVKSLSDYLNNAEIIFNQKYGSVKDYHILALLPSYLERANSSLVFMADHFIKKSDSEFSGFYLNDLNDLSIALQRAYASNRKVLLIGVTFALLDLIEHNQFNMPKLIVMETGGMKGRRKELIREELHAQLSLGFGVSQIHSEYGMTELLSQAYSFGKGIYQSPPSLKVLIRELNDPFSYQIAGKNGGVNVIDLANVDSCAFIETQDMGKTHADGSFEILGRFDNSDIRGCNLLLN